MARKFSHLPSLPAAALRWLNEAWRTEPMIETGAADAPPASLQFAHS